MDVERIQIDQPTLEDDFIRHLNHAGNERIILSGPFGSGKTTFLNRIQSISDEFIFFTIYPVNYSISTNEDIIDLIKYDIILELLENHYADFETEEYQFSKWLILQMFTINKIGSFNPIGSQSASVIELVPESDRPSYLLLMNFLANKLSRSLSTIADSFKAFERDANTPSEIKTLGNFTKQLEARLASAETDVVTHTIKLLIGKIKSKHTEKPVVLIIEDLDRLDPEHIFRLINIFSAHYDTRSGKNRYGFDKIILVCDLRNIRKIYHHKYGSGVDFSGYIDKFYSTTPFDFDNRTFITQHIDSLLAQVPFNKNLQIRAFDIGTQGEFATIVKWMSISFVEARKLTLRKILSYPIHEVTPYDIAIEEYEVLQSHRIKLLIVFNFLYGFFGSWDDFSEQLKYLSENAPTKRISSNLSIPPENLEKIAGDLCLPFIIPYDNFLMPNTETAEKKIYSEILGYDILVRNKLSGETTEKLQYVGSFKNENQIKLNPYYILYKTFNYCRLNGFIKHLNA
jgi:hypothetical protein